ncbi:MAG: hypothetical protein U9Q77_10650, partial [Candidatus Marinimicrobia bacterium]|nr:hypothetical protein [Candidatus Neomarinimicrobiota bacterium]
MDSHITRFYFKHLRPIVSLGVGMLLLIGPSKQIHAFEYIDHPNNPIFSGSQSWNDLAVISPLVLFENSVYKMWHGGRANGLPIQIGYATSSDGITWTENPDLILEVGPPGAFDADGVKKFTVIHDETGYKLWYTGLNLTDDTQQIGLATSADGINWEKYGQNPVIPSGPSGSWNEIWSKDPSVLKIDGAYHMWYSGKEAEGDNAIGLAYSMDGISWQEYENNPIIFHNPDMEWESAWITFPKVTIREDGSLVMFYVGSAGVNWQIGMAHSPDGITWTKHLNNPIITYNEPGTWNSLYSTGPSLVIMEPGHYSLWYAGNDGSNHWHIGYGDLLFDTMGDVNYDYQTDISDLIRLISIILGNLTASEYQLEV